MFRLKFQLLKGQAAKKNRANHEEKVHKDNKWYRRIIISFVVSCPDKMAQDCGNKQTVDDHGKQHE